MKYCSNATHNVRARDRKGENIFQKDPKVARARIESASAEQGLSDQGNDLIKFIDYETNSKQYSKEGGGDSRDRIEARRTQKRRSGSASLYPCQKP